MAHIVNQHVIRQLAKTLTKFLSSTDAEWDKILPFTCYCFNTTPTADNLESPFFFVNGRDPLEDCTRLLGKSDVRYLGDDKVFLLFTEICKLWLVHTKALQENRQLKSDKVEKTSILKLTILKLVN